MNKSEFAKCECRHCAGHIEFPAGAGGQSIACPHCGQAVELPGEPLTTVLTKSRRLPGWISAILGILIATAAIGLFILKGPYPAPSARKVPEIPAAIPKPPAPETMTNNFAVSAFKLEKTTGNSLVHITGAVRNLTDKQRFGVKVEFSLFDAKGVLVGKASDYTGTLGAQGAWKFKAMVMASKAVEARFDAVREDQ